MAQTEDLAPKSVHQRRTVAPPPATSTPRQEPDNQDDGQRRQYSHPSSRTLHRIRLTQQDEQTSPTTQTIRTTENLVPAHIQDATGEPDDTVLIPELPQTSPGARRQFMPRSTTGKMAAVSPPTTEHLIQRAAPPIQANVQQEDAHPDPVAQLAQLRRRKRGRTTKI